MGKINESGEITFENQKNMEIQDIFEINLHLKHRSDIEFTAC